MRPTSTSLDKHDATLGYAKAPAYFFLGDFSFVTKLHDFQNLFTVEKMKWGFFSKSFAFRVNSFCSALLAGVLHIIRAGSSKKVVGINTMRIVAFMTNFMPCFGDSKMENEAGNVSTNQSSTSPALSNNAVFFALRPNPATVRFFDTLNKSAWQCRRAANRIQKFWRDIFGIKTPLNQFGLSHA